MILVDSSVWISFFRNGTYSADIEYLISEQLLVINEVILAELMPFLHIQNKQKTIKILQNIQQLPLTINWQNISTCQVKCLRNGNPSIGIIDIIIAQNAMDNNASIFSEDKHFNHLQKVLSFSSYTPL